MRLGQRLKYNKDLLKIAMETDPIAFFDLSNELRLDHELREIRTKWFYSLRVPYGITLTF